jgi:hypothetical protein
MTTTASTAMAMTAGAAFSTMASNCENATISDDSPSNNYNGTITHNPGSFSNSNNRKSMHNPGGNKSRNSIKVDSMCDDDDSTGSSRNGSNNRLQVLSHTWQFLISTTNCTKRPSNSKDDECLFMYNPSGTPSSTANANAA